MSSVTDTLKTPLLPQNNLIAQLNRYVQKHPEFWETARTIAACIEVPVPKTPGIGRATLIDFQHRKEATIVVFPCRQEGLSKEERKSVGKQVIAQQGLLGYINALCSGAINQEMDRRGRQEMFERLFPLQNVKARLEVDPAFQPSADAMRLLRQEPSKENETAFDTTFAAYVNNLSDNEKAEIGKCMYSQALPLVHRIFNFVEKISNPSNLVEVAAEIDGFISEGNLLKNKPTPTLPQRPARKWCCW